MLGFEGDPVSILSRLFGRKTTVKDEIAELQEWAVKREKYRNDEYFALLERIEENKSNDNYKMLEYCEKTLPLLPQFVEKWKQMDGEFSINSIPAIELGCKFWAVINDRSHLDAVKAVVESVPELREGWAGEVVAAFAMEQVSREIQAYVRDHPGTVQSKLKDLIGKPGQMISEVAYWLDRLGKLRRVKAGRSYELYIE